jgi:hypothetical protein
MMCAMLIWLSSWQVWNWATLAQWALVLIGLGATVTAFWTLSVIRRQTTASEVASKAALLSAEAYVNVERPWLLVEVTGSSFGFSFNVRNGGNTPAKIVWLDPLIASLMMTNGNELPSVPPYGYGFYENGVLVNAAWVAPGGIKHIGTFDSFEAHPGFDVDTREYEGGRLFIYSAIKYRNSFDERVHETRFCYRYGGGELYMDGPVGYNEVT